MSKINYSAIKSREITTVGRVFCGSLMPFEVTFGHEVIKRGVNPSGPACAGRIYVRFATS